MPERLYNQFGSTKLQFEVAKIINPKINGLVSELVGIMKEYDLDPRDFKTYCKDSMDLDFCQFFVRLGVEKRKESQNG